ncbi:hypothetical protein HanIR_Chr17g0902951 [Helianthus annuus]|nr:hypothetical protein HanIR_Chr17g0902951 [Helianthus annuus]
MSFPSGLDPPYGMGGQPHPLKKISGMFLRKSRPHPLEIFVRTNWKIPTAPVRKKC